MNIHTLYSCFSLFCTYGSDVKPNRIQIHVQGELNALNAGAQGEKELYLETTVREANGRLSHESC